MSTKERLIGAMSSSMRERGYGSSAMKDIIGEADATAGSLYHHFPEGKEQLAAAAVRDVGMANRDALVAVMEASGSVADGTVAFYEALIDEMEESDFRFGCPVGVPSTEAAYMVSAVREAGAEVFGEWTTAIATGLEREGWESARAERAARFAVSAYEGASTLARATKDTVYLRDTLGVVIEVLRNP